MNENEYVVIEVKVGEREYLQLTELVNKPEWKAFEELLQKIREQNRNQLESADISEKDTQLLRGDCKRVNRILNLRNAILAAHLQAKRQAASR